MRIARQQAPSIQHALESHPEFREITVGRGTADGGCILVAGSVATQTQLERLKSLIASMKPRVSVTYSVWVAEYRK